MDVTHMDYQFAVRVSHLMDCRRESLVNAEEARHDIKNAQTRLGRAEARLAADEYVIVRATGHPIDKIHREWEKARVSGFRGFHDDTTVPRMCEFATFLAENRVSGTKGIGK